MDSDFRRNGAYPIPLKTCSVPRYGRVENDFFNSLIKFVYYQINRGSQESLNYISGKTAAQIECSMIPLDLETTMGYFPIRRSCFSLYISDNSIFSLYIVGRGAILMLKLMIPRSRAT